MVLNRHFVIEQVRRELQANLSITLTELSDRIGVERHSIQRILREVLGLRFGELRAQERLKLAASLLVDSNQGVKEVSKRSGYRQSADFSRAFKRHTGKTPTRFRLSGSKTDRHKEKLP